MSYIFITFTVGIVSFILITELVRIKQKIMDFIDKVQKLYESNDEIVDSIHKINGSIKEIDRVIEDDFTNVEKHNTEITNQLNELTNQVDELIEKEEDITNQVDKLIEKEEKIMNQVDELTEKEKEITNQVDAFTEKEKEITNQVNELIKKEEEIANQVNALIEKEKIQFQIKKVAKRVRDYCEFFKTCDMWSKNTVIERSVDLINTRKQLFDEMTQIKILRNCFDERKGPINNRIIYPELETGDIWYETESIVTKYIQPSDYYLLHIQIQNTDRLHKMNIYGSPYDEHTRFKAISHKAMYAGTKMENACDINMRNFQETDDEYELRVLKWLEWRGDNLYQKYKYYMLFINP